MPRLTVACVALLLLAGCDVAGPDPTPSQPATVRGVLTSQATGGPLAGVAVDVRSLGPYLGYHVYDSAVTDADGRFELDARSATQSGASYDLVVNDPVQRDLPLPPDERLYRPYVSGWTARGAGVPVAAEMRIVVQEFAELLVYATAETPLGPGDRAFVSTPCSGSVDVPTRSGCAVANADNTVTLNVTRDGVTTTRTERVYTPLGETTVVRWTY